MLLALVLAASPLSDAMRDYADLDYESCVAKLAAARALAAKERAQADLMLGLCHFALGHEATARAHLEAALRRDPALRAPPNASPKERALIDEIAAAVAAAPAPEHKRPGKKPPATASRQPPGASAEPPRQPPGEAGSASRQPAGEQPGAASRQPGGSTEPSSASRQPGSGAAPRQPAGESPGSASREAAGSTEAGSASRQPGGSTAPGSASRQPGGEPPGSADQPASRQPAGEQPGPADQPGSAARQVGGSPDQSAARQPGGGSVDQSAARRQPASEGTQASAEPGARPADAPTVAPVLTPSSAQAGVPTLTTPPERKAAWVPFVVGGVAVVAAGTGAAFGINARIQESAGRAAPVQLDADRLRTDAQTSATAANVAFAVAGTAAVAAVITFIVLR